MKMNLNIREDHGKNLPTIRIAKIVLNHFKSVRHGKIIMNCGKKHIPYGTKADILGIYGQNGSGKTSIIEAISILKCLMSGDEVPDIYADCIDVSAEYSELEFTFDVQYPDNNGDYPSNSDIRRVVYSFKLEAVEKDKKPQVQFIKKSTDDSAQMPSYDKRVRVFDEILQVGGTILGKKTPLKPFLNSTKSELTPSTRVRLLLGEITEEKRIDIQVNKKLASERSESFLFMDEMMQLYENNGEYSVYYQLMLELNLYATGFILVFNSKMNGIVNLSYVLPIAVFGGYIPIDLTRINVYDDNTLKVITDTVDSISIVLSAIVPGLQIQTKIGAPTTDEEGIESHYFELVAVRNGIELPLRCESDGVRKLIATLNSLITAYNQQSFTIAYDEFDAGVFEYLLGEILQVLQTSGKGQLIFTSHNMRPLEVLKKEFVYFTTTDPDNRYIRLKNLGETNNLRRVYYREIALHEHYDNLYNDTKRAQIISALRKARTEME